MASLTKQAPSLPARSHDLGRTRPSPHLAKLTSLQRRLQQGTLQQHEHEDSGAASTSGRDSLPTVLHELRLQQALRSRQQAVRQDLSRLDVVASRMLRLSAELDMDVSAVARLCSGKEGVDLLLVEPRELQARIQAVAQALRISVEDALDLVSRDPACLKRPVASLRQSLTRTAALFKSRGLPSLAQLAKLEPKLLRSSAADLAAKLDALPTALGAAPPRVVRALLEACPEILRRSPEAVHARHQTLVKWLTGVPRSYLSELVSTTPSLMQLSPALLDAKFHTLVDKFRDDVVDVVLVDPLALVNAQPKLPSPPPSSSSSSSHSHPSGSSTPAPASSNSKGSSSKASKSTTAPLPTSTSSTSFSPTTASPPTPSTPGSQASPSMATSQDAPPAQPWRSPVKQLLAEAEQSGITLFDALKLHAGSTLPSHQHHPATDAAAQPAAAAAQGVGMSSLHQAVPSGALGVTSETQPLRLPSRLQALSSALGASTAVARDMAGRCPWLLLLPPREVRRRVDALSSLIAASSSDQGRSPAASPPPSQPAALQQRQQRQQQQQRAAGGVAAGLVGAGGVRGDAGWVAAVRLLATQPELLLQSPEEMLSRVRVVEQHLAVSPQGAMRLLQQQTRLLLMPSQSLVDQLQALSAALGGLLSARMMGELALREPALLQASPDLVRARFDELCGAFGPFTDDALGVVLADPAMLLRPSSSAAAGAAGPARVGKSSSSSSHGASAAGLGREHEEGASGQQRGGRREGGADAGAKGRAGGVAAKGSGGERKGRARAGAGVGGKDEETAAAAAALDAMVQAEREQQQAGARRQAAQRKLKKQQQQQQQEEQAGRGAA